MNKSISELDAIDKVRQQDMLLISQKTGSGYVSKRIDATGFRGESAYEQWKGEQTSPIKYLNDTLLSSVRDAKDTTDANIINELHLNEIFKKWLATNNSTINQFLTQNNLTEEYQQYITANENKTFNNFITENNHTDVFNNFVTVNQTTLQQTFVNNTTMGDVYNNYYQTNVVNQFLTQNNLTQQFLTENKTFNDFITENNLTQTFNDYTTTNNITYQTIAQQVINQYQLQTIYQQWVDNRVTYLTQNVYIQAMTPKAVRPVPVPQHEEFWISLFSNDVEPSAVGSELILQQIVLPEPIELDNNGGHCSYFASTGEYLDRLPNLLMHGMFYKRDINNPDDEIEVNSPILLRIEGSSSDVRVNTISLPLLDNERLMCYPAVPLRFEWEKAPSKPVVASMTFVAKKRRRIPSDSAVIKLSGWFKITDSLKGEVLGSSFMGDVYGQRNVHGVSSFGILSDELQHSTDPTSGFFYNDYSVVATGYSGDLQNATVTIKNMSKQARTLTFTPVSWSGMGYDYKSSVDNTYFDLPSNARLENGSIIIDLSPSEDE